MPASIIVSLAIHLWQGSGKKGTCRKNRPGIGCDCGRKCKSGNHCQWVRLVRRAPMAGKTKNADLFRCSEKIIYKWTEKNGAETYLTPSGYTGTVARGGETGSNGLTLSPSGQLAICQHGDRRIAVMNADPANPKPVFATVTDNYKGKKFNSPNDLVYNANGDVFFTDPPYGLEKNMDDRLKELPFQGVYKVKKTGELVLLTDSITRPNGIAITPNQKTLIVANSDPLKPYWYAFDFGAGDQLINPRIFYDASEAAKTEEGMPDGLKIDTKGNIYATGPGGVWIFDKNAKLLGKIKFGGPTSNCAFSTDEKTLYITADMYVLRVKLRK